MTRDDPNPPGGWLGRWSRVKLEATREKAARDGSCRHAEPACPPPRRRRRTLPVRRGRRRQSASDRTVAAGRIADDRLRFHGVPQPKVDETLKRQALKQLFRDPHFNVMDGLDIVHRRLFEARSDRRRGRAADGAGSLHLRSAANAGERAGIVEDVPRTRPCRRGGRVPDASDGSIARRSRSRLDRRPRREPSFRRRSPSDVDHAGAPVRSAATIPSRRRQ